MNNIIKIKDLCSGYSNKQIINNITLNIIRGEFVGILGPNGSGKTTLLKTITGIVKKNSGEIFIDNKEQDDYLRNELSKKITVVKQSIENIQISVMDYIMLGRLPYFNKFQFFETKKDKEIVDYYVKLTGIDSLLTKQMDEISGGEKQLVQITKALTQETKLLFLDEPISNLDIAHQIKILDLIKKLNKELKLTVIIVLHDLNIASEYCDKLCLMSKGKMLFYNEPYKVLTYQNIEQIYNTGVIVQKNPYTNKPYIIPITSEMKEQLNKQNS